ncbi:Acyl-CoA synthetase short-chain family member 3, mitochondrial, partial [Lamellibrachia satsuma]
GKPVGTPGPSAYYRIITDHKVAGMFAAPTAIRAVRREDPNGDAGKDFKFPHFRYFFLAGEYCDHETMDYAEQHFRVPCLDNWWQTETGSAITSTCVGLGTDLDPPGVLLEELYQGGMVLRSEDHSEADVEELGSIVVKLPLPPSAFSTLWNNEDGFKKLYFSTFPGYYDTMDAGFRDKQGNIAITARVDDVINVAGHRLSTGQLEEAMLEHGAVAEAAVIPVPDPLKGHVPLGFYVLKSGVSVDEEQLETEIVLAVREHVGPVASFRLAIAIKKLPKTRSGKVARKTMASMITRKPYNIPVTIEDASVYTHLEEVLRKKGYDPLPPSVESG